MANRWSSVTAFFAALVLYGTFVALLEATLGVFYETNDDVGTMMYAHGFGLGQEPSPILLFSNIWLGRLVLLIGTPFDRYGYGLFLVGAQMIAMAAIGAALGRLNGHSWLSIVLTGIIGLRGLMMPQFTVVAGFLGIAAVVLTLVYARDRSVALLVAAASLAFLGLLIRPEMLALVLLGSLPLLLRWTLLRSKAAWVAGVVLVAMYGVASFDHTRALAAPEWRDFRELNLLRGAITDFGVGAQLIANPEAQRAGGLSANDSALLANWWFLDPAITSPAALRAAIAVVGQQSWFFLDDKRLAALWTDLSQLDMAAALGLAGCLFFLMRPERARWLWAALIMGMAVVAITAAGRTGVVRVVFPLVALLACAAFADMRNGRKVLWGAVATAMFAGAVTLATLGRVAYQRAAIANAASEALSQLAPERVHLVWGSLLPFEALYRPLQNRNSMPPHRFFGIGTHQRSPLALAHFGGRIENLFAAYRSDEGLSYLTSPNFKPLLAIHCSERLKGNLDARDTRSGLGIFSETYTCLGRDSSSPE